ncbi:hypothetical protein [Enterobacter kobei]|uniref:helix-turn-helix transcriptional regulator n=1 Tax=Enterobacter kobei TaxID=208224 RepID=UPI002FD08186
METIIKTSCTYLKIALKNMTMDVLHELKPDVDMIIFIDTRDIKNNTLPFFNEKKLLFIYITDGVSNLNKNRITISSSIQTFTSNLRWIFTSTNRNKHRLSEVYIEDKSFSSLTQLELATIFPLCDGISIKDVALNQNISCKTVYSRVTKIKKKFDCKSIPLLINRISIHKEILTKMMDLKRE